MKISQDDVTAIARLSRLELTRDECDLFSTQLSAILEYVETLGGIAADSVPEGLPADSLRNVMRSDEVKPSLSSDQALQNAPDRFRNFYRVPKIIE